MLNSIVKSFNDIFRLSLSSLGLINLEYNSGNEFNIPNPNLVSPNSNKLSELFQIIKEGDKEEFVKTFKNYECNILYETFPQSCDTLVHWACLSGNLDILLYLKFTDENNKDSPIPWLTLINNKNALHQTPLHWACTIENISVIQFLINEGADINAADTKGATPLIMACQHGNVSGALFLITNGADISLTDTEGDNALHWSLYKGHAELSRLLIFHGLDFSQKDNFGQTPLHFACLSGNINCVVDLIEKDNVEINVYDNNHKTPLMLAAGRKYGVIVEYLKLQIKIRIRKLSCLNKWKYMIIGSPYKTRIPMLFFLVCSLLWGNPYYFYVIRPSTIDGYLFHNYFFTICQCLMWFCFTMCSLKDPGYLKSNESNYSNLLNEVKFIGNFRNMKHRDYKNPINKICHTCRNVKPTRSRHCKICNKCVEEMDHHCPYVGNCIGKRNRFWFLLFIILMNIVNASAGYLLYRACSKSTLLIHTVILTYSLICLGLLFGLTVNFFLCKQAVQNVTLIESQKWKNYNYLQDESGSFLNPFDQGWISNILIFLNVKTMNKTFKC